MANDKYLEKPFISEQDSIQKDLDKIKELESYKKYWEPRWYLAKAFIEGSHFTNGKMGVNGGWKNMNYMGKGRPIRQIPKAKKQLDSTRNLLLKVKQRPVVYPDANIILADNAEGDDAKAEREMAKIQARYVEYYQNEVMKLSRYKKKLVRNAQLYGCSFIQILNEEGKKSFEVYDPFDVSIFPTISNINDYPILTKTIPRRITDLVDNELYDQSVVEDLKKSQQKDGYSSSKYKNAYMSERYGRAPEGMVLVKELFEVIKVTINPETEEIVDDKEHFYDSFDEVEKVPQVDEEGNAVIDEEGNQIMDEQEIETPELYEEERVRVRAYIGTELVRDETTELTKLPFAMFIWGDEAYQTSFMEELMPINKLYDIFFSKLEHKARKMDTGRYAVQANENIKTISENDGEYIRYKRVPPRVMEEASVPNAFMNIFQTIENDMKELGVAMTSAAGLPQGVEAWRAIESLKESDSASLGNQLDNLNECLVDITEKLTEMLANDITDEEVVQIRDENNEIKSYRILGKRAADAREAMGIEIPEDVIIINPYRNTKVEIESDMTWTTEGKRAFVLDMVKSGILDKQGAIEMLEVGNAKDILEKLKSQETVGKTMIDMPDFQVLSPELQQQVLQELMGETPAGGEELPPEGLPPQ